MPANAFDFTRWLQPEEIDLLSAPERWRWISTLGDGSVAPVEHPRHARWIRARGNSHAPAYREVMLMFRGSAVHQLAGKIYLRMPGTVMLFDHHEARDLKGATYKRSFHTLWLHFHSRHGVTCNSNSCDSKGRYFQEIPSHVMEGQQVATVMDAWDHCRKAPADRLCRELLRAQITALLLQALGQVPKEEAGHHQQVVAAVQTYIHDHLGSALPLEGLAQIAGYSPFFFHRLFHRITGQTPVEYVNTLRLEKAKTLLREGYTTQSVAETVGFASTSYFSNLFRRKLGLPPREWASQAARPLKTK